MTYPFAGTIKTKLTTDAEGKPVMAWSEVEEPTEVMRITRDGIWVNPDMKVDEAAQAVLAALDNNIKVLVKKAVEAEREACAGMVWPTEQVKVWSDEELTAMGRAFNRAQEKHGWYETIMAVGATALQGRAAAIRARSKT